MVGSMYTCDNSQKNVPSLQYSKFYFILYIFFSMYSSKEKHSLTRKLVGYRNWRQKWCKMEGNKVLRKG